MPKEIEVRKIEELEPGVIYHINLEAGAPAEILEKFADALRANRLKALVTVGEVKVETFLDLIEALPVEKKLLVRAALDKKIKVEFDPTQFEQTK